MTNLIVTTPEQLQQLIAETVRQAIAGQFQELQTQEPEPEQTNDILTRKQAADLLGVSFPTLYNWENLGYIKRYKKGPRGVWYSRSELNQALKGYSIPTKND